MRRLKTIVQFLTVFILCLSVWTLVRISGLIIGEQPPIILEHVPSKADFAMRIDGREIGESTLFSVLLESKDETILRLLEKAVLERTSGEAEFKSTGINFLSDIVVFSYPHRKGMISGFLFNLLNEDTYLNNMPEIVGNDQVISASGNIGVMISYMPSGNEMISEAELNYEARNICLTRSERNHAIFKSGRKDKRYTELHLHTGKNTDHPQEMNLVFEQNGQRFHLEGDVFSPKGNSTDPLAFKLEEKGLHLTNTIFADEWADSLISFLSFLNADLPRISGLSMNYFGTRLINHTNGYMALPQMELVIQCSSPFSIRELLKTEDIQSGIDYTIDSNTLRFGSEKLYYKQLNSYCFYIGSTEHPGLIELKSDQTTLFTMKGSLEPMVNVEGSGWMVSLLKMLPLFQASQKLANSSERIDLLIKKIDSNNSRISGDLTFRDGYYPMTEVMRFMLISRQFSDSRMVP